MVCGSDAVLNCKEKELHVAAQEPNSGTKLRLHMTGIKKKSLTAKPTGLCPITERESETSHSVPGTVAERRRQT